MHNYHPLTIHLLSLEEILTMMFLGKLTIHLDPCHLHMVNGTNLLQWAHQEKTSTGLPLKSGKVFHPKMNFGDFMVDLMNGYIPADDQKAPGALIINVIEDHPLNFDVTCFVETGNLVCEIFHQISQWMIEECKKVFIGLMNTIDPLVVRHYEIRSGGNGVMSLRGEGETSLML